MDKEHNHFEEGEFLTDLGQPKKIAEIRGILRKILGEGTCQKLALALMNDRCLPEALPAKTIEEAVPQLAERYPGTPLNLLNVRGLKSGITGLKDNLLPGKKTICRILYAMKANSQAAILQTMREAGIGGFDCASSNEADTALMQGAPAEDIYYNFPKHSPQELTSVLQKGVRYVTVDTAEALAGAIKAARDLPDAENLRIAVRIAVKNPDAAMPMEEKFGIPSDENGRIREMLKTIRNSGGRPGICVHVGSQTQDPEIYRKAIETVAALAREAGGVNHINLGGGLPVDYFGVIPHPPEDFFREINEAVETHISDDVLTGDNQKILFEFGRFLIAPHVHWISPIRSMEIKDGLPYLNYAGGIHNTLNGLKVHGWPMPPADVIAPDGAKRQGKKITCVLSGESCNPADMLQAEIPSDTAVGDYLKLANAGAYTDSYGSHFNGFTLPLYALYNT
ncbi:hypothetical protein JXA05_04085 [Candidatus Peregrinibacteria bacterium]|nr:hypothetical protein [Candidatus Peregrinibacteria bacterium]